MAACFVKKNSIFQFAGVPAFVLFSYETMQLFTSLELLGLTVLLGTLVIALTGLFMFAVSLYISRSAAVTAAFLMVIMIYLVENIFA